MLYHVPSIYIYIWGGVRGSFKVQMFLTCLYLRSCHFPLMMYKNNCKMCKYIRKKIYEEAVNTNCMLKASKAQMRIFIELFSQLSVTYRLEIFLSLLPANTSLCIINIRNIYILCTPFCIFTRYKQRLN